MALYEIDGRRPMLPDDGSCWIAPDAQLIGDVRLGRNVSIWFGVVIRADNSEIVIGDDSNVQDGSVLHSDPGVPCVIGEGCTVGHHAVLHGCRLGRNVLVGMSATLLNRATIGEDSLVGAGSIVTEGKAFAPGNLIVGSPARVIRPLDQSAIEALRESARSYVARSRDYARGLRRVD